MHIRGRIDRIDLLADSPHAAVFDYKLSAGRLSASEIYNGLALQLLTYLLVLQSNGHQLAGSPITPAAGFYLQLLRGLEAVDHPDDAPDMASDQFHLKPKPRGIFDAAHLAILDHQLTQGESEMWKVQIKKDGGFGFRESSDVCDANEFLGVLDFVRGKLAHLADGILSGSIQIFPYRLHRKSPCAQCEFKSVCRFDVTLNGYNMLADISRDELLKTPR